MRRGISLLEVLISIFILAIGLLGVAALLPVGAHEVGEANAVDRSAALARASLHDIKVRSLAHPFLPSIRTGEAAVPMWDFAGTAPQFLWIDPLYAGKKGIAGLHGGFPHAGAPALTIPRADIRTAPITNAPWMRVTPVAELIFRGTDDLILLDRTKAPQPEGQFSWAFMLSYSRADEALPLCLRSRVGVSVVVFHRRQLDGERVVQVTGFSGTGMSGGDVAITLGSGEDTKLLRKNRWLLLLGPNGGYQGSTVGAAAWYRVVAATEPDGSLDVRATLSGPDWDATVNPTAQVVLLDSVRAVHTETMNLNQDILRTTQDHP